MYIKPLHITINTVNPEISRDKDRSSHKPEVIVLSDDSSDESSDIDSPIHIRSVKSAPEVLTVPDGDNDKDDDDDENTISDRNLINRKFGLYKYHKHAMEDDNLINDRNIDVILDRFSRNTNCFYLPTDMVRTIFEERNKDKKIKDESKISDPALVAVINPNNLHWILVHVINKEGIRIYDSSAKRRTGKPPEDYWKLYELFQDPQRLESNKIQYVQECPAQSDGTSCGIFVCLAAINILHGISVPKEWPEGIVDGFRKKWIGIIYEGKPYE